MTATPALPVVAALGVPGGMRSLVVPATLGFRDVAFGGPLKYILAGAFAGEVVADQHPDMGSRPGADRPLAVAEDLLALGLTPAISASLDRSSR